jgi:hypothetical protein
MHIVQCSEASISCRNVHVSFRQRRKCRWGAYMPFEIRPCESLQDVVDEVVEHKVSSNVVPVKLHEIQIIMYQDVKAYAVMRVSPTSLRKLHP